MVLSFVMHHRATFDKQPSVRVAGGFCLSNQFELRDEIEEKPHPVRPNHFDGFAASRRQFILD